MSLSAPAERHLPLAGTYNLRDVGGYPTDRGGQTRWRVLYRSDSLHRLDAAGQERLIELGLRTVIDQFRGSGLLFLLFVGTWLVPFQATMIPNYVLLSRWAGSTRSRRSWCRTWAARSGSSCCGNT